jgi:putative sigma-54 modulation protein
MKIIIQSPHIKLSNRIERVIAEKFERLEKVSDRIIRCEIVLKKEKNAKDNDFVVEARLAVPGNDLFSKESGPKFEIAAEDVCLDLERQLRKRKGKRLPAAKKMVMKEEED